MTIKTFYCSIHGSQFTFLSKQALLIRGIPESSIFTVRASSRLIAINKSDQIINARAKNNND